MIMVVNMTNDLTSLCQAIAMFAFQYKPTSQIRPVLLK